MEKEVGIECPALRRKGGKWATNNNEQFGRFHYACCIECDTTSTVSQPNA